MRKSENSVRVQKIILVRNLFLALSLILAIAAGITAQTHIRVQFSVKEERAKGDSRVWVHSGNNRRNVGFRRETRTTVWQDQGSRAEMSLTALILGVLGIHLTAAAGLAIYAGCLQRKDTMRRKSIQHDTGVTVKDSCMDRERRRQPQAVQVGPVDFGKAHHIGRRPEQQDSFGKAEVFQGQGALAVVADGMGGLAGGDQVSQRIVMGMLTYAAQIGPDQMDGILQQMVRNVNEDVNQMLGQSGLYKSGSTLVAVLVKRNRFHWISVGDSRIYLYREGYLLQVNQEHTLLQEWMPEVLDGAMSYTEAVQNPEGRKLTSFIGMGKLKLVDCSLRSVEITEGDRILLMSDGVFGTLPEQEMADILKQHTDVQQAAEAFERRILAAQVPKQDNFTVVILGF